jgi:hypothetical protein
MGRGLANKQVAAATGPRECERNGSESAEMGKDRSGPANCGKNLSFFCRFLNLSRGPGKTA